MHASSASVTSGRPPGPRMVNPRGQRSRLGTCYTGIIDRAAAFTRDGVVNILTGLGGVLELRYARDL